MPRKRTTPKKQEETSAPARSLVNGVESSPVELLGGTPAQGATIPPRLEPNVPFLLMYHPHRFTCMEDRDGKAYLVPCPAKLKLVDGVQGIYRDRSGRIQWRDAGPQVEQVGYTILPTGVDSVIGNYLRKTEVRGGFHHHEAWATAHAGANYFTVDVKGYAAFWERLFSAGVIARPPRHVFERMLESLRPKVLAAATRARLDETLADELQRLRRQEAAILEALSQYEAAPAAASSEVEI
jgi:hypothetical protein